jgi:inhibitor of cysteine peptidase
MKRNKFKILLLSSLLFGFSSLGFADDTATASDDSVKSENSVQPDKAEKTEKVGKTLLPLIKRDNNGVVFTDPQKTIMVKSSSPTFSVILQSNPTTGYSWSLKSYDNVLIRPISKKFYPSKSGLIGAGGYEKWIFAVKSAGFVVPQTTSITLIYARPWDLQGAQATNFKVVTANDN